MFTEWLKGKLRPVDDYLNRTTMYRFVVYYLVALWLIAWWFCFLHVFPYSSLDLFTGTAFLVAVCYLANRFFSWAFDVSPNTESWLITALILSLIIDPARPAENFLFLLWAAILAMALKYILAVNRKHIFNPAAIAVVLTALAVNRSATWWIGGSMATMPFVIIGGLMVVRKLRRADMIASFFIATSITVGLTSWNMGNNPLQSIATALTHAPIFFFAFVMLTEPLTTPPARATRMIYGTLTGILFAPAIHVGSLYSTPELALAVANIYSFSVSSRMNLMLAFRERRLIAERIYEYLFEVDRRLEFTPGQYMEFTLAHEHSDNRGNRRYFTIASSPREVELRLGIKFYQRSSSFKTALESLEAGDVVAARNLAGDFVLPQKTTKKIALIAGGIGVTPFRSMIADLLERGERRDVVLVYASRNGDEFAYTDLFAQAKEKLGIQTIYITTNERKLDAVLMTSEIPDWRERMFYLSGPHSMVESFSLSLRTMGVHSKNIKIDYFPGFA